MRNKQVTKKQFVYKAIDKLRKPYTNKQGKTVKPAGLHVVRDGFNNAFRAYFGENADPIKTVNELIEKGELEGHPVKGGFKIYKPGEMPKSEPKEKKEEQAKKALEKMELL